MKSGPLTPCVIYSDVPTYASV